MLGAMHVLIAKEDYEDYGVQRAPTKLTICAP